MSEILWDSHKMVVYYIMGLDKRMRKVVTCMYGYKTTAIASRVG